MHWAESINGGPFPNLWAYFHKPTMRRASCLNSTRSTVIVISFISASSVSDSPAEDRGGEPDLRGAGSDEAHPWAKGITQRHCVRPDSVRGAAAMKQTHCKCQLCLLQKERKSVFIVCIFCIWAKWVLKKHMYCLTMETLSSLINRSRIKRIIHPTMGTSTQTLS